MRVRTPWKIHCIREGGGSDARGRQRGREFYLAALRPCPRRPWHFDRRLWPWLLPSLAGCRPPSRCRCPPLTTHFHLVIFPHTYKVYLHVCIYNIRISQSLQPRLDVNRAVFLKMLLLLHPTCMNHAVQNAGLGTLLLFSLHFQCKEKRSSIYLVCI